MTSTQIFEAIRNADKRPAALIVAAALFVYLVAGLIKSDVQRKQEQLDDLVTWVRWTQENCSKQPGKTLYVCKNGYGFHGYSKPDAADYNLCMTDIKNCRRVPERRTMFAVTASR